MTEQEYITRIHNEILEIMDLIHTLCEKNGIRYYLTGGSLLGAVRHGGFIPWDDDLDIAMPRDDYQRFMEIYKTDLPKEYALKNILIDSDCVFLFSKVYKKKTVFLEDKKNNTEMGIFVDIFPLDETDGPTLKVRIRKYVLLKVRACIVGKNFPDALPFTKRIIARLFNKKFLIKTLNVLMCTTNGKNKVYFTNFASQYSVERKTQLKTVYGNGSLIPFEGRMYMAPDDYKTDLLSNFGPKYMELPPVEKRRTHYPVKVVFSDGTVFEPKSIKNNKVSVEESIDW